ncbi:GNAT family N-acetyltransferase [Oceanirhabdus seepicola]|uniref:N-acetyltransferase n=1 Tax=Oceanirhabdus seepicola TaxID=2828781 RepID=A0A9J6P0M1_9CLOT|nr:GNAT family N-acetyltransferase [Oceanirhabdus seepicola]MCM1989742.1 N-acetyltransferase [Oceanirhabdus seepicola]
MEETIIKFVKMTESEFEEFYKLENENYAEDLNKVFNTPKEEAYSQATKTFDSYLSDGLNTENNYLYSIIESESNNQIGTLWLIARENNNIKELFIASIRIFNQYQGKGYGKISMSLVDKKASELNVAKIALHVFGYNKNAISLYEKVGFEPFSINMEKFLD